MATTFAVPDGRVAMNTVLRNGFGTSGGSVSSLNFQPDFIWEKRRNVAAGNHFLVDSVRGATKTISSNITSVEATYNNYFISFNSNGYSLGVGDYTSTDSLVDWCWKAGGTAVTNTSGTITSSVSANPTAGFSVVTFTSPATSITFTVGHGLGVAPAMIFLKDRGQTSYWGVYHSGATTNNNSLYLNTTDVVTASTNVWGTALPTNTVFGSYAGVGTQLNDTCVAYCWAPVAGYSAFGKYTGNGSADGPFIYTGFRPRWLMIKSSSGAFNWFIEDSSRNTTNVTGLDLSPNLSDAEANNSPTFDFLSNGFKLRNTYTSQNGSGSTYIYAAFAENPLKYSNAR
jgi:hypothetical protein